MKILVAYATRHGATKGIAERIAETLEQTGFEVTLRSVDDAGPIEEFGAVRHRKRGLPRRLAG